jgi:hypothetical protein
MDLPISSKCYKSVNISTGSVTGHTWPAGKIEGIDIHCKVLMDESEHKHERKEWCRQNWNFLLVAILD